MEGSLAEGGIRGKKLIADSSWLIGGGGSGMTGMGSRRRRERRGLKGLKRNMENNERHGLTQSSELTEERHQ